MENEQNTQETTTPEISPEQIAANAQETLDNMQTHEDALEEITADESLPKKNDRIYLKSPFASTHVEFTVTDVKEEENPATEESDTAFTFHDGSKLYKSDLAKEGFSWSPVPVPEKLRNDEIED